MKIGYARVSTERQNLEMQIKALEKEGCEKIYHEIISGVKTKRPQLIEMLKFARKGDTIVVWKLDRLGRSLKELIKIVGDLKEKEIEFNSIQDKIDTTTPMGNFMFHLMASLAEFERELIRERTRAGLDSARARGRKGGRRHGISKNLKEKAEVVYKLYHAKMPVREIAKNQGISLMSVYKCEKYHAAILRGEKPDEIDKQLNDEKYNQDKNL